MPDLEHMLMDRIRILEALYLVDRIREAHPAQTQDLTTISLSTIDPTQASLYLISFFSIIFLTHGARFLYVLEFLFKSSSFDISE